MKVEPTFEPFQIIHHARSNRATKSRKSSYSTNEKDRVKVKSKKMRKMTMNPESLDQENIKEIEQLQERAAIKSVTDQVMEEEEQLCDLGQYLDFGQTKVQSSQQLELENGIWHGLGTERDLDEDFKCGWKQNGIDWLMPEWPN